MLGLFHEIRRSKPREIDVKEIIDQMNAHIGDSISKRFNLKLLVSKRVPAFLFNSLISLFGLGHTKNLRKPPLLVYPLQM